MAERLLADRIDDLVDAVVARGGQAPVEAELAPFWELAVELREQPHPAFRARLKEDLVRRAETMQQTTVVPFVPAGFRSLTPYLIARDAGRLITFMKQAFGAQERVRIDLPDGTIQHATVLIGDSVLELADGGGAWTPEPAAIHLYVDDADATYARAVAAGAISLIAPTDMPYGDREADVRDPLGNHWYIGTHQQDGPIPAGMHTVTPTLHARGTGRLIEFIKQAFGAQELDRTLGADGRVMHAQLQLGDSVLELGEAGGFVPEMRCSIHYYVEKVDAVYTRALAAGATSLGAPADKPYGDRAAEVVDPFGNRWFLATLLRVVS
jgi:PhnB protein